jgi:5'-3' exonuclease
MTIQLQPSLGPVLLIDMSYYVFYRYFATYNWYKRQNNANAIVETIMENEEFVQKYAKMFEKTLLDLVKTYKINELTNIVFVKDCCRDNIWRHKHYDSYKATRDEKSTTFNKDVFNYTYHTLMPRLQEKLGFQIIGHYCLEADDVIAIITNTVFEQSPYKVSITIITNDNDYIQLMNHERLLRNQTDILLIKNLQHKSICDRIGCSPLQYINFKKIIGDKSDNIPSIIKKCGEKTAQKLSSDESALLALFTKDDNAKKQFELNDLLIDFNKIPLEYVEDIKNKVTII